MDKHFKLDMFLYLPWELFFFVFAHIKTKRTCKKKVH